MLQSVQLRMAESFLIFAQFLDTVMTVFVHLRVYRNFRLIIMWSSEYFLLICLHEIAWGLGQILL